MRPSQLFLALALLLLPQQGEASVYIDTIAGSGNRVANTWRIGTDSAYINGSFIGGGSQPVQLVLQGTTVGVGHRWFDVPFGLEFTPDYASAATPFATNFGEIRTGPLPVQPVPFFLGVQIDADAGTPPLYGWVELFYDRDGLRVLNSALEDTQSGMLVGMDTVIPEPTTLLLIAATLGLFSVRRRR